MAANIAERFVSFIRATPPEHGASAHVVALPTSVGRESCSRQQLLRTDALF
jgi:hypothetical protein